MIPALVKKRVDPREAGTPEIVVGWDRSATRQFLFVENADEGIVLATGRYEGK